MRFYIVQSADEVQKLRPLAKQWLEECNCKSFGVETDMDKHLAELASLVKGENSDLIMLISGKYAEIAGYMGIERFISPLGSQKVANEHYFFVAKKFRGTSMRLIRAAKDWARAMGCSHLIMTASNMASDMHDKVCKLYEHSGMKKFETSYICEVK